MQSVLAGEQRTELLGQWESELRLGGVKVFSGVGWGGRVLTGQPGRGWVQKVLTGQTGNG